MHDDCEALLEGYVEPRLAASHTPDWTVTLQNTLHISHALVPTEQEYEFVVTLQSDVIRFCAPSWECMQEWVEALRSKLREMKILSPKENVYSKLPEIKHPLLPTRDPTSPLPLPPPVPAAIVPGVECVVTPPVPTLSSIPSSTSATTTTTITTTASMTPSTSSTNHQSISTTSTSSSSSTSTPVTVTTAGPSTINTTSESEMDVSNVEVIELSSESQTESLESESFDVVPATTMTNTTPQSLINLLSNPIQAYSNHNIKKQRKNAIPSTSNQLNSTTDINTHEPVPSTSKNTTNNSFSPQNFMKSSLNMLQKHDSGSSLAKIFTDNVLSEPNRGSTSSLVKATASTSLAVEYNPTIEQNSMSDEGEIYLLMFVWQFNDFFLFF